MNCRDHYHCRRPQGAATCAIHRMACAELGVRTAVDPCPTCSERWVEIDTAELQKFGTPVILSQVVDPRKVIDLGVNPTLKDLEQHGFFSSPEYERALDAFREDTAKKIEAERYARGWLPTPTDDPAKLNYEVKAANAGYPEPGDGERKRLHKLIDQLTMERERWKHLHSYAEKTVKDANATLVCVGEILGDREGENVKTTAARARRELGEALVECGRMGKVIKNLQLELLAIGSTVILQVMEERRNQDRQWGGADHDDEHDRKDWLHFIDEHNARAKTALATSGKKHNDWDEYRQQLVEVAALAVAAVEAHDRNRKAGQ